MNGKSKSTKVTMSHVSLLRGANVGGKNKLPMKTLAELFADEGCAEVRTYIQSGNVVYQASKRLAHRIPDLITKGISERFGLDIPVVTRTIDELRAVVRCNPYVRAGVDPAKLHVAFLSTTPAAARVAALDVDRSPPDEFIVVGREIFLHCPNGTARTKLTNAYFDSMLQTMSTVRNWRTVLKLLELADAC